MNECIRTHRRHQEAAGWCRKHKTVPVFHGVLRLDCLSWRPGVAHVPPSSRRQEVLLHVLLQQCQLKNGGGGLVACDR